MSWQERLQRASFRGVEFLFDDATFDEGRLLSVRTIPGRDSPDIQDLNRSEAVIQFRAIFTGDDHDLDGRAFLAELVRTGPGRLIHPYRGPLDIQIERYGQRHSRSDPGQTVFEVSAYVVDTQTDAPQTSLTSQADVAQRAADLNGSAKRSVSSGLKSRGVPEWVRESSTGQLLKVSSAIGKIRLIGTARTELQIFSASLTNLTTRATALAAEPAQLANELFGLFDQIGDLGMSGRSTIEAYAQLFRVDRPVPSAESRLGLDADRNAALIWRATVCAGLAGAARYAAAEPWDGLSDALEMVRRIRAALDLVRSEQDDQLTQAAADCVAGLQDLFPLVNDQAPKRSVLVLEQTMPAAVVAYRVYGRTDLMDQLARRNGARHPLFMRGGTEVTI